MFEVREAHPDEYHEIGRLTVAAYESLLGLRGLDGYKDELMDVAARAGCGAVLVAVDDVGALVGAVGYVGGPGSPMSEFDDQDGCGVRMLAVEPDRQGEGAGRLLMEACLERGRAEQRGRIILHTTEAMKAAQVLYERLGFTRSTGRDILIPKEELDGDRPLLLIAYERPL